MSVEPANFCQLRCPECPVGLRGERREAKGERGTPLLGGAGGGLLTMETFHRILDQVQATAHTMQFYFQGEPLLNKQLPEMIAAAHKAGLYTIVSTNAQSLSQDMANALVQSGLNRIIVSIDGFSEESYQAYRVGGSLQKALDALRCLANTKRLHKSHIRIELQTLRLKTNEHEWQWIKKNYKKLGATHLVFKTAQLYNFEHGHPLMPTDERYSRYRKTANGTYIHKSYHLSPLALSPHRLIASQPCLRLWSGCVITTNGDVLPCCYDKDHLHTLGNITTHSLSEIFHSSKANTLRKHILNGHLPEMCKNCNH